MNQIQTTILLWVYVWTQSKFIERLLFGRLRWGTFVHMDDTTDDLIFWLLVLPQDRRQGVFERFLDILAGFLGDYGASNIWAHFYTRILQSVPDFPVEMIYDLVNDGTMINLVSGLPLYTSTDRLRSARNLYPSELQCIEDIEALKALDENTEEAIPFAQTETYRDIFESERELA